jgi:hydrogenase nickel incorporation protein HypB
MYATRGCVHRPASPATLRGRLEALEVRAVNLMSSAGSGKTTLIERTVHDLGGRRSVSVVEGDQATTLDAERIRRTGVDVVQVNTGVGCHLSAPVLDRALDDLDPAPKSLLFVENVGNLVFPTQMDLGESSRVVIVAVTEGTETPLKYPHMFATADLVVINKLDLLPYVEFDVDACRLHVASVNPAARVITVSATGGDNLTDWYGWLFG